MTNPTHEAEHRERAVEAVMKAFWFDKRDWRTYSPGELAQMQSEVTDALKAADPHLKRIHFEQFAEMLLEHEVKADATRAMNMAFNDAASDFEQYEAAIEAALDSIREGEDG